MSDAIRRPDPDVILTRITADEAQAHRGKLKIFLGYAAGVGKTYAMLEASHQRQRQGVDVVVGIAETHGRTETEAMLRDLEIIPRKQLDYRGILLQEMDIDAILARHPRLVLVDELAHTNASGSRHTKRYQDVEELLEHDIDVYTTLNIQHIESLNDVVAQITGVHVGETIPDRVIDEANELELVDLPPDELLQRLREGRVYIPDQAARAIQKFFRSGNLTALRELAMRRAAERVDDQMRAYMETRAIPGPWPAKDRLLACISPSPLAERLIRTTRRLADELKAEWVAVYIESPDERHPQEEQDRIYRSLRLAEELGGKAETIPGRSMAEAVLTYARSHNITKIIIGKPIRPRWREFLRGSPVDQIMRASGPIDVYIISGTPTATHEPRTATWRPHRPWSRYLNSVLLVAAGTLLSALVHPLFSPANLVMIYLLTVLVAAILLGRGPAILASILSVAAFDFFFVPPTMTMAVTDSEYILTFAALLAVSLVVSNLAVRVRDAAQLAVRRESQTAELYDLSRDLAVAVDLQTILEAVIRHVNQTFDRPAAVLTPYELSDAVVPRAQTPGMDLNANELAVATWTFRHAQPAGHGTDTLPAAAARYLPLTTARGVVGVLSVGKPTGTQERLSPDELHLLGAFASQAALAIERARLAEQARHAEVLQATEKLQTALLNSISHDLRTPLVAITGTLSSLQEDDAALDAETRRSLVDNAVAEAERLNRLVGNLLDMTRIEAGALRLLLEPCELEDVIGSALEQLGKRVDGRQVSVLVPQGFPMLSMDFALMSQVFVNLLDNALKYSPAGSPIRVTASVNLGAAEVEVADRGIGIPPEDLARVFDKFYRVQRPGSVSGTGLGLSICKGIVEAHGGTIDAQNRPDGGTAVTISLPIPRDESEALEG